MFSLSMNMSLVQGIGFVYDFENTTGPSILSINADPLTKEHVIYFQELTPEIDSSKVIMFWSAEVQVLLEYLEQLPGTVYAPGTKEVLNKLYPISIERDTKTNELWIG